MKILHTADWHIGQFKGPVVDGVNLRSQDTVKCLEYMVKVAREEQPDIVCISGDIFHQEQIGPVRYSDEMINATNIITSLAHFAKYVVVMRGTPNHDGGGQFRVLNRMLLNVKNVSVVTEPVACRGSMQLFRCIVYLDGSEFEKVTFAAGAEEATALKEAFASSKNFVVDITDASGAVTAVSQSAFADGADPTVTNADYSAGLKEVEKYYFNTICVDTEDAAVHALVAAFLDRIYLAGSFGMAIVTPKPSSSLEDRMTSISSFDTENVIAPLNANANAGNEELKGYQVAAYIAGVVAATPANQSVTHATLSRYSVLNEILTNTEMEVAEEKGCLVLSTASDGAVWLDNGVNTLVHPDANHDSGWKKIRRTKTRYELLNRANAAADALVGKVDNDTNGRATIMAAIQGICNAMEAEGKIQYGNVTESTTVTTDGDTCGFDIEVIDLDSAEHIYLNYYFQFSTIVAASGE